MKSVTASPHRRERVRCPRRVGVALCAALLVAAAGGCQRGDRTHPNVLLIVIDTLRADRLSAYGEKRDLTPFLDSLGARGALFMNTYATSSWTNPSVASLITSRYQSQHHITSFAAILGEEETTLAEVLRGAGYATGGFSANYLIDTGRGFGQGFDTYRVFADLRTTESGRRTFGKARGARLRDECLAWLDEIARTRRGAPAFVYLHYMEPHNPYEPEPEYLERVLDGRPAHDRDHINRRMLGANIGVFDDETLQGVTDYYDAEVSSLDTSLRELFAALEKRGFLDNAVVAITSDHGEELREHGHVGHGQTLYQEVIRVPLILLPPRARQGRRVDALVSLLDVAPTLLDLAGMETATRFAGQSLTPLLEGRDGGRAFAFSELLQDPSERLTPHERSVIDTSSKMIVGAGGGREFFDLRSDPAEQNPEGLDAVARPRLGEELDRFVEHYTGEEASEAPTLSPDTLERMRALGYHADEKTTP